MSKEKVLFDLMGEFFGEDQAVDGVFVTDHMESEMGFRCFTSSGLSFDVIQEYACEPDEVDQYTGVEYDGYTYTFRSELDGFKKLTLGEATNILKKKIDEFI